MKRQTGFTLLELMIVVTVIGILAAVAYPSYLEHMKKARRAEAQSLMLDVVNREEQYMLDKRAYTDSFGDISVKREEFDCISDPTECTNDWYDVTITLSAGPPPGYTITATAKGSQASDGDQTIDSTGTKTGKW
jgi:prepilin-type N-terminal cleavage/methylation domain